MTSVPMVRSTGCGEHPAVSGLRGLPRAVWVLAIGSFINRFGGFVVVFLVLYMRHLGYPVTWAGLATSAYAAGKLTAGPTGGELTDRAGPRACIAVSMFGSAGVTLALPEVRGLPGLLALSFLAGLLGELYRPSTSKLITQAAVGADRVTAFGVYQSGVSAGTAAGPAIMLIAPSAGTAIYHDSPHLVWWLALTAGLAAAAVLIPDLRLSTRPLTNRERTDWGNENENTTTCRFPRTCGPPTRFDHAQVTSRE